MYDFLTVVFLLVLLYHRAPAVKARFMSLTVWWRVVIVLGLLVIVLSNPFLEGIAFCLFVLFIIGAIIGERSTGSSGN